MEDSYIGMHVIEPTVGHRRLLGSLADACCTHVTKYCVVIVYSYPMINSE